MPPLSYTTVMGWSPLHAMAVRWPRGGEEMAGKFLQDALAISASHSAEGVGGGG